MIKSICTLILLFISLWINSQTDNVPNSRINHLVGLDLGYSNYDAVVAYKGEVNLNYVFNPGLFCAKLQAGIAPSTNFGVLTRANISAGFSTKINKVISWHLLLGCCFLNPSKLTYNGYFIRAVAEPMLESGFYIRPFKNKNAVFGINSYITDVIIETNRYSERNFIYNINVSFNLLLNRTKKETK